MTDTKNGRKSGKETDPGRDAKGRFTGSKPGPGRGHRKIQPERDSLEQASQVIQDALKSRDIKVRLKAVSLLPKLEAMTPPKEEPDMSELAFQLLHVLIPLAAKYETSGVDVLKRMAKQCLDCNRLGETTVDHDQGCPPGGGMTESALGVPSIYGTLRVAHKRKITHLPPSSRFTVRRILWAAESASVSEVRRPSESGRFSSSG